MSEYGSVRGYRLTYEKKEDRQLSYGYMLQDARSSKLNQDLWRAAANPGDPAPCVGREDEFSGDTLPSDREAALMCAQCPLATFRLCGEWAEASHLAFGVAGGKVFGRKLEEILNEGED